MKKLILGITALAGLVSAVASHAEVPNSLGYIAPNKTATIYCGASRFFPGSPPTTIVANERVGGLETNFLVTNTSEDKTLEIVKIDIYAMTGQLISRLTPRSIIPTPDGDPFFKWTIAPHETTRLPNQATLPLTQQSKPYLLWNNVVFTVKNAGPGSILAPMVFSDFIEKELPSLGGNVLARVRADCVYR